MIALKLTDTEHEEVRELVDRIAMEPTNHEEFSFLQRAAVYAQRLPPRIRETFYEFKLRETDYALLVSNNPIQASDIGHTPQRHRSADESIISKPMMLHAMHASLLGEPFGFRTQQSGHVFNDVIPIKEQAAVSNSSAGSDEKFGFHTEDCFHPHMPDYLGLLCLRNLEQAATYISSLRDVTIPPHIKDVLFENRFWIRANPMHKQVNPDLIQRKSILFGDRNNPYLRINTALLDLKDYDEETAGAMKFVINALERNRVSVVLRAGDCLYVDNFQAVHGRDAYRPNYGPHARWICRVVVARDLRKSRDLREKPDSRIIR